MTAWSTVTPLADDEPQRSYWREFKIGDRVRVRLSGECQQEGWMGSATKKVWHVGHDDAEDGQSGTVVECPFIKRDGFCIEESHRVAILFDTSPLTIRGVKIRGGHYASIELEPLEEA